MKIIRFEKYTAPSFAPAEEEGSVVVVRVKISNTGEIEDAAVLSSPNEATSDAALSATTGWRLAPILDEHGTYREAVIAFGIRTSVAK